MTDAPSYGALDRTLHRVAFGGEPGRLGLQMRLAEMEDGLFARDIAETRASRPVFVASLPRAGTTLLLNLLSAAPEFATHTYRDMPFVLAPLLWRRLSRTFRKEAIEAERAHGDGLRIGFDSPEAFEEVLWLAFWHGKYSDDHIDLWTPSDRNDDFETFFRRHMRKVVVARTADRTAAGTARMPDRYLSKNNANIARLRLLPEIFPDCRIVVPIRAPWPQSRSLMRQHRRFSSMHAQDTFAQRYMGWIGHFEFGANHRPIRFGDDIGGGPADPAFWLRYWIAAHGEILDASESSNVVLVDFATLRSEPRRSLTTLANALDMSEPEALLAAAPQISGTQEGANKGEFKNSPLADRAEALYSALRRRCRNRPSARAPSRDTRQ